MMNENKITTFFVVAEGQPRGIVHIHDILENRPFVTYGGAAAKSLISSPPLPPVFLPLSQRYRGGSGRAIAASSP